MQVGKKFLTMKKLIYTVFAIATLVLTSCSNKVDLWSNDGDSTIVYALLDASADTNFIKITKSFVGNVNDLGHVYEANNYSYDDLEVTLTGVFEGSSATQTIALDTVSRWIAYNDQSVFYSGCRQVYYYTTRKLLEGKEYTLNILRKTDNVVVSAKTETINTFVFQKPAATVDITFTDVPTSIAYVEWRVNDFPYKSTASFFEVTGYFRYKELQPGAQDTAIMEIVWPFGEGKEESLYNTSTNMPYYVISYTPSALYSILERNDYLQTHSPVGVERWFDKFEIRVSAIGEDLYNYYLVSNSSSAIQDVPNYSNIENGVGIMSARISRSLHLNISEKTRNKIHDKFPDYGFPHTPGK